MKTAIVAGLALEFAMGAMVQSANISGSLVTNDFTNFGPTQTSIGGYFALPSNIGNYSRTVFAVVPEIGLNLGYQITSWASVFVGYTFLYTNNVIRPATRSTAPSTRPRTPRTRKTRPRSSRGRRSRLSSSTARISGPRASTWAWPAREVSR